MSDRVLPTAGCQLSSVDLSNNQRRRMANPAIKMDDYAAIKDMVCTKCIIGTKISYLHALNFLNGTEKLETKSLQQNHMVAKQNHMVAILTTTIYSAGCKLSIHRLKDPVCALLNDPASDMN
jgi:hypothetical protein